MMTLVHDESSVKATDQKLLFYSCIVLRSSVNRHRSWMQIHLRCTIMSSEPGYDIIVSQQLDDSSVIPAFAISVREFDATIADAVCKLMGDMENTRYKMSKDTESLYLVEYPVYAITS